MGNGQGYLVNPGYLLDDTGYVNVTVNENNEI